jgi:putative ABC transport system permease protein
VRDANRIGRWLESLWLDAAYTLRSLARQRAFTLVAVLTLALGVGANTAIFSVIDTLLLRPPGLRNLDRIVFIWASNPRKVPFDIDPSPADFLDWRERTRSFEAMAAWRNWYFTLAEPTAQASRSESIRGVRVSPAFFTSLGARPAIGRTFAPDEEQPGKHQVLLLTDALWNRRFGRDPAVVGRTVLVDSVPFVVVGVLPPDFHFFQPDLDIWMPLPVDASLHDRRSHSVMVFAWLKPGVTLPQAQAEMEGMARELAAAYPDTNEGWTAKLARIYPTAEIRAVQPALLILFAASGLVLLIACANVANLLLARATARHREVAVRAALGASRGRLVRQMLTESIVLAVIGGSAGTLVAYAGIGLLGPLLPHVGTNRSISTFRAVAPALDARMLAFSLIVAIATGVVFGMVPALRSTESASLRWWMSAHAPRPRAARLLIVAELALSIVLLTGAGLLIESFWHLQRIDPGFQPSHLLTMQVVLPKQAYASAVAVRNFYQDVTHRLSAVGGVTEAAAVSYRPFLGMGTGAPFEIAGRTAPPGQEQIAIEYRVVTPGFRRVIGQRLLDGRDFDEADGPDGDGVAIVNETMARRFWPNARAVGQRIRPAFQRTTVPWEMDAAPRWLTVVGVVGDVRGFVPRERDQSQVYVSSLQFPFAYMFLVLRTKVPPAMVAAAAQAEIRRVDPDQPVSDVRTMDDALAVSVPRFNVELLGLFALVSVLLAAVGVYGVCAYGVSRRTQEIGVRMALGARSGDVVAMIVGETLRLAMVGTAIGIAASLAFTRAMSSLLYGVAPTDVRAYAAAALLLAIVVLAACLIPARRAAGLDPAVTLRA